MRNYLSKTNRPIKRIFIVCFLILMMSIVWGFTKQDVTQKLLVIGALKNHFQPLPIDDAYSKQVFHLFIEKLDPNKRFFTQEDILQLSPYKYAIDDHIEEDRFDFFDAVTQRYQNRLESILKHVPMILEKPQDFSKKETLETDPDKRTFMSDEDQLVDYWEKLVQYQVLTQYINYKVADVTGNETIDNVFNADYEKKARLKVKGDIINRLTQLSEEDREQRLNLFMDCLMNVFDVHSNYFPAQKKEDFDINISGKLEGIGAVLSEEDGFIKVVSIVPGSASWKQGDLKAEDVILTVTQDKESDPVSIVGARIRDAVTLIRGKKGTTVYLHVKHPDGEVEDIAIVRDVVVIEETYAKHAIIEDQRFDRRFGYIYLPKFYRDFQNSNGKNTTDDVRNALEELNTHGVDGMILDLRYNEGGALIDAVYTAGLFIEAGPIVQVKGKSPVHNILKDRDRSVVYDGPLVVLINMYSASASEILAAALQDYNRAVIVGTNSFGKGTVQTFVDLDSMSSAQTTPFHPLGSMKLTIQKFYRINGGSTQHKGVIPDIELPNQANYLDVGERFLDNALPWDTVNQLSYRSWYSQLINSTSLSKQSAQRIASSKEYQALLTYIDFVKHKTNTTMVPLDAATAIADKIESQTKSKTYEESIQPFEHISIVLPHKDALSKGQEESYETWKNTLAKDLHLNETIAVLNDLIDETRVLTHP